jgi:hypothetical protein
VRPAVTLTKAWTKSRKLTLVPAPDFSPGKRVFKPA